MNPMNSSLKKLNDKQDKLCEEIIALTEVLMENKTKDEQEQTRLEINKLCKESEENLAEIEKITHSTNNMNTISHKPNTKIYRIYKKTTFGYFLVGEYLSTSPSPIFTPNEHRASKIFSENECKDLGLTSNAIVLPILQP
jgi:hypothetical protein